MLSESLILSRTDRALWLRRAMAEEAEAEIRSLRVVLELLDNPHFIAASPTERFFVQLYEAEKARLVAANNGIVNDAIRKQAHGNAEGLLRDSFANIPHSPGKTYSQAYGEVYDYYHNRARAGSPGTGVRAPAIAQPPPLPTARPRRPPLPQGPTPRTDNIAYSPLPTGYTVREMQADPSTRSVIQPGEAKQYPNGLIVYRRPDGKLVQEHELLPTPERTVRKGQERSLPTSSEYPVNSGEARSHSSAEAILGSPFAIRLAPHNTFNNRTMKRLENYIRRFADRLDRSGPNRYFLNTTTETVPGSLHMKGIVYQIREVTPKGEAHSASNSASIQIVGHIPL